MVRKLKVAVSGLGRMGARHALHFLEKTPRAELIAACDPDPKCRTWAEQILAPYGTTIYDNFDDMLQHEGIEAIVIATITTAHAEQAIKAIEAEKHVLCEKPLSTSVDVSQAVVDAASQKPYLKVMHRAWRGATLVGLALFDPRLVTSWIHPASLWTMPNSPAAFSSTAMCTTLILRSGFSVRIVWSRVLQRLALLL
jgi:hypothetical protein